MADQNFEETNQHIPDITSFVPTKMKKKKKKFPVRADDSVEKLTKKTDKLTIYDGAEDAFSCLKRKNIASVKSIDFSDDNADSGEDLEDADRIGNGFAQSWYCGDGSERDYKYEELLNRIFCVLREDNPELAGDKCRTILRPPQVLQEGTKKTVFVNFMDLCKTMHRQPEHVMAFLLAEMGTSGSLDEQQRLAVKGQFSPKIFEGIVRKYINEYVLCSCCKSPDTIISNENRLFFLRCEQCGSERSLGPFKTGYVAKVERRKAGM
ncbi:eukaryotic translation initiation factor 2 subunit beta [Senna tora]|uniref:Eukaryotic translation initiation factor 2 subunit beta n=1 Tax=Senna tora TaxID=362788 RepID=A0A834TQ98_9FABA|nr:eukaryotic translation initiation factor 2 subunit beta [Senna tora]